MRGLFSGVPPPNCFPLGEFERSGDHFSRAYKKAIIKSVVV